MLVTTKPTPSRFFTHTKLRHQVQPAPVLRGLQVQPAPVARVGSVHRLEAAIRNCGGKIQPYALTDGRPTAEQPQDAPIGRLAFPGVAKRARRGATRARPGINPTSCPPRNYLRRFASTARSRGSRWERERPSPAKKDIELREKNEGFFVLLRGLQVEPAPVVQNDNLSAK